MNISKITFTKILFFLLWAPSLIFVGCHKPLEEHEVISETTPNTIAYIDLGDEGYIEFLEPKSGELVVGAMFTDPSKELEEIQKSPLAVYEYYTGKKPSIELISAYERSQELNIGATIEKNIPEDIHASDISESSRLKMSGDDFFNNYYNLPAYQYMTYKNYYTYRTGYGATQRNCFTIGMVASPYRGTITMRIQTLYSSGWSTLLTKSISEGSVYRAYYGGHWHTRKAEIIDANGDGYHYGYYGMDKKIVVVSLGGSSSTDIHGVVEDCMEAEDVQLNSNNWTKDKGDGICSSSDAKRIKNKINDLADDNSGIKNNLRFLIVGKSAGGVLAWNTFKRHFGSIDDFNRVAMVLVDPHGSVTDDGNVGPYCDRQSLYWPSSWIKNKSYFRVYNIYQHSNGLTGASFPSSYVYKNIKLTGNVSHDNIPGKPETKDLIREAIRFLK